MNKNKVVGLALASALLVGGTFAGTKALFSDTVQVNNELVFSTGDLDIEQIIEPNQINGGWVLDRNGDESLDGVMDGIMNLKPGDKIKKTVTIKNAGVLDAKISIEQLKEGGIIGSAAGAFTCSITGGDIENEILYAGHIREIELVVTMNEDAGGEHRKDKTPGNYNTDYLEPQTLELNSLCKVSAKQITEE